MNIEFVPPSMKKEGATAKGSLVVKKLKHPEKQRIQLKYQKLSKLAGGGDLSELPAEDLMSFGETLEELINEAFQYVVKVDIKVGDEHLKDVDALMYHDDAAEIVNEVGYGLLTGFIDPDKKKNSGKKSKAK